MIAISVLMSVYKEPIEWVKEAVNSILNQTFKDFEFLICLDNPDYVEMKDYLSQLTLIDQRVRIIYNKENIGLTKSLNILLKEANGKYIARMDADDISLQNRFEKQFAFMEKNENVIVSGTAIRRFGNRENVTYYEIEPKNNYIYFTSPTPFLSPFAHPTVFIRKKILDEHNVKYNENYITAQDFGLWNDLIFLGDFANLNEILLKYRVSDIQISKNKKTDQINNTENIIDDHVFKWLMINGFEVENKINPYILIDLISNDLGKSEFNKKIISMTYAILSNRKYNFNYTFLFLLKNKRFNIGLKMKLKMLIKKLLNK